MRVLIDENLPRDFVPYIKGHQCQTVVECGWAGKRNGELLQLAEATFQVLITLDKSVQYQQNMNNRKIGVLILRAQPNRIQDLIPLAPAGLAALESVQEGSVMVVGRKPDHAV
jgi:hypothetical protein